MDEASIGPPQDVWLAVKQMQRGTSGSRRLTQDDVLSALATYRGAWELVRRIAVPIVGLQVLGLPVFEEFEALMCRSTTSLTITSEGTSVRRGRMERPTRGLTPHGHLVRYRRPPGSVQEEVTAAFRQAQWSTVGGSWLPGEASLRCIGERCDRSMGWDRMRYSPTPIVGT